MHNLSTLPEAPRHLLPPPAGIQYFAFGLKEQIADSFWVRSLQDFEYCEQKKDKVNCENNGWLWKMLDSVTDLSPDFRIAYATGAVALSIIVSDIEGASKLFDKAVKQYPTDWSILYRAAYHAIYEEHNKAKAAKLLIDVAKYGGPPWAVALAGRMYSESGHVELAEKLLEDLKAQNAPQVLIDRVQLRIDEAKNKSK